MKCFKKFSTESFNGFLLIALGARLKVWGLIASPLCHHRFTKVYQQFASNASSGEIFFKSTCSAPRAMLAMLHFIAQEEGQGVYLLQQ